MATNKTIGQLTNGGASQLTDQIPVSRLPYGTSDNYYVNPSMVTLHVDTSTSQTGANTTPTILKTFTVVGGTLSTNGSYLVVKSFIVCASNTNTKTITVDVPNNSSTYTTTTSGDLIQFETILLRLSATTYQLTTTINGLSASKPVDFANNISLGGGNFTQDFTVSVSGTNGTPSSGDIASFYFIVQAFKI